ncbi:DUF3606 domain-containing protein [Chitinophaga sp. LS1]|uniref:DUF3606 domain-containing protein n=1 Tax=Chitinophaga sp. LS1 TaxID=3051176 RepID=UPI002AAC31BA|nr:DUF3606 domain-containing protein [Chitinophaga sp. LS1]WPV66330.1 DUF3606 domain-containing protein [Chitinophaga sp. LS1]
MSDNLKRKRPQDSSKISLTEDWEVQYWCKELGVSYQKLYAAVRKVGHSTAKVRQYIKDSK